MGGEEPRHPATNTEQNHKRRAARKNGFETPLDPLQILSWFIIVFLAASFVGLLAPMLNAEWHIASLAVYLTFLVVLMGSGYECAKRDPADKCIKMTEEELVGEANLLKCSACSSRVNRLSRHCLICDKCVVDYDHHCKWLNNCIGQENYRPFLFLLGSVTLLVAWQLIVSAVLFSHYVGTEVSIAADVSTCPVSTEVYVTLLCCNLLVGVPALLLVTHLVGFHIFLNYHGLTTYNYVMQQQAKEEKAKKAKEAAKEEAKGAATKYIEGSSSGSEYETDDDDDDEEITPDGPNDAELSKEQCEDTAAPCSGKCVDDPVAAIISSDEIEKSREICVSGIPGVITSDGEVQKDMVVSVHVNKAKLPHEAAQSRSVLGPSQLGPPHRLAPLPGLPPEAPADAVTES